MAIKKGAFELYTQKRELPEKGQKQIKSSHFFDDLHKEKNGSQSVHNQCTDNRLVSSDLTLQNIEINNKFDSNKHSAEESRTTIDELDNGPQSVHNQFTDNRLVSSDLTLQNIEINNKFDSNKHNAEESRTTIDELDNGPQSVHNQFTDNRLVSSDLTLQNIEINNKFDSNKHTTVESRTTLNELNIGSQLVHNWFANRIEKNQIETVSHDNSNTKSVISFSKLIGNQREIIIALYKNMRVNKSDTTEELTLEIIANLAGVNQKSLKNTLFRLTSAGFLSRAEQKNGRGGWVKYKINDQIINELQQKDFFITLKNKNSIK